MQSKSSDDVPSAARFDAAVRLLEIELSRTVSDGFLLPAISVPGHSALPVERVKRQGLKRKSRRWARNYCLMSPVERIHVLSAMLDLAAYTHAV